MLKLKRFHFTTTGAIVICSFLGSFLPIYGQISVLTQHNDTARTGQNLSESILTPANVSSGGFGKVFTLGVDGEVLAQPLYLPAVTVGASAHNVVFVATEHDSVYAFDADSGGAPLWQASMLTAAHGAAAGATSDPEYESGCGDLATEYGITGTPVIDPVSKTLYLVSDTFENGYAVQRLHALDVTTGLEKLGGPVVISASVAGSGSGSSGGVVAFDPKWQNQRAGLLLANGTVYIAWGSHCDFGAYHGWMMAYNASTLAQTGVFLTTPNGEGSGIWMGSAGLAIDNENGATRMFVALGNGTYDATLPYATNTVDYGDDILRFNLNSGLVIGDAFTTTDQASRQAFDVDLGSGGVLILPDQPGPYPHLLVQSGKGNEIFVLNRENLGGYSTTANKVVQEIDNEDTYLYGIPAYWNENIYTWSAADSLKQFSLANGRLSSAPVAIGQYRASSGLGAIPSISANGTSNAIVWAVDASVNPEVLYAVDATNVANTFWTSANDAARDAGGPNVKYATPTIVNGKVYVPSGGQVTVYGLLPLPNFSLSAASNSVSVAAGGTATDTITITDLNGFSGAVVFNASNLPSGVTVNFAAAAGNSAVATITAAASAVAGSYPVTITGTAGALVNSIGVSVQVQAAGTFTLTATPASLAVQQGTSASSSIAVKAANGFSGAPTFTASGLPTGVTAAFSPTSSATSTTVTFSASASAWVGTFPVTVTGSYGSIVQTASVSLSVTHGLSLTSVQLINKATGACADVNGMSVAIGAQIGQAACWGGSNQLWNLTAIAGGTYQFVSINSGLSLDISASSKAAGAVAVQDTYNKLLSQQWKLQQTSDGYFNLVNANSAQCLDGVESSVSTGDESQQQVCSGAASQKWSLVPLSNTTTVNLSPSANVYAIATNGTAALNGGLDGGGDVFSETTVGAGYSWYGYSFVFGAANVADAVSNTTVALPGGQYSGLYFLATATGGGYPNQVFKVNYSDGTSTTLQQGVSNWSYGSALYPGEEIALTVPYRLWQGWQDNRQFNIYGFSMELDSTRTAVSITLPATRNVATLAMTLSRN
jgi:hypothetical protein